MSIFITPEDVIRELANLRQITFETTELCNLHCKYCFYGDFYIDSSDRKGNDINIKSALNLLDYLIPLWNSEYNMSDHAVLYVSFYGGEPLLNFDFIEKITLYLSNLKLSNRDIKFTITTNATLLDKYMHFLVKNNFDIYISLDGNEYNNSYRLKKNGEPSFFKVCENIDKIRISFPDFFTSNVHFNSDLHNRNSIEDIYNFFHRNYNKLPSIGELNTVGIRDDKAKQFKKTYKKYDDNGTVNNDLVNDESLLYSTKYKSLIHFLYNSKGLSFNDYSDLMFEKNNKAKRIPTGTCLPFSRKMFVSAYGDILPCEKIGLEHTLGHVNENSVDINVEAIAATYNNYLNDIFMNQCNSCCNQACGSCIFCLKFIDGRPHCNNYMDLQTFEIYKDKQIDILRGNPSLYFNIMKNIKFK